MNTLDGTRLKMQESEKFNELLKLRREHEKAKEQIKKLEAQNIELSDLLFGSRL